MPQPPDGIDESTGTLRGCSLRGVEVPGVAGGVKAGDRRDGGGKGLWSEAIEFSVAVGASTSRSRGDDGPADDREKPSCSSFCAFSLPVKREMS